jgi:hypothetical protein
MEKAKRVFEAAVQAEQAGDSARAIRLGFAQKVGLNGFAA